MPEMEMERKVVVIPASSEQWSVERAVAQCCYYNLTLFSSPPSKDDVSGPLLEPSEAGRLVLLTTTTPVQSSVVSALSNPGGLQ